MKKGNICGICVKMVAAWGVFYESKTQIAQMKAPLTRQGLLTQTDNADSVEVNLLTVEPGVFLGAEPIPNARYSDMMLNKISAVSVLKLWWHGEFSMEPKAEITEIYRRSFECYL